MQFEHDVVVVGGCGHVGLPLGLAFAETGLDVVLFDTNAHVVDMVNGGSMPFAEHGAADLLTQVLATGRLHATTDSAAIDQSEHIIVVVGTPVDRYLSPDVEAVARRVVAHCGLPWDRKCLDFHRTERVVRTSSATQVRKPIYTSSIGRGRAYGALLQPLLAELQPLVLGPDSGPRHSGAAE